MGDALRTASDLRPMSEIVAEDQAEADTLGSSRAAIKRGRVTP